MVHRRILAAHEISPSLGIRLHVRLRPDVFGHAKQRLVLRGNPGRCGLEVVFVATCESISDLCCRRLCQLYEITDNLNNDYSQDDRL